MIVHAPRSIWAYRGFILGSVKREFQCKYRNSVLGAAWTEINPLAMILVYTLFFSEVMRVRLPGIENSFGFSIFLCAGLLACGGDRQCVHHLERTRPQYRRRSTRAFRQRCAR